MHGSDPVWGLTPAAPTMVETGVKMFSIQNKPLRLEPIRVQIPLGARGFQYLQVTERFSFHKLMEGLL
jgi:hypothetical protein